MTAPFDLFTTPLDQPRLFIEASAGTGKTFSLNGIILRLLIQEHIPLPEILVVTFTEAATAELRQRVRNAIVELRSAFTDGPQATDDPLAKAFAERYADPSAGHDAGLLLDKALAAFDKAAVFTFHGFCTRMLAENAFESRGPFEAGTVVPEHDLLNEVAADYWRRLFLDAADPALLHLVRASGFSTPDTFAGALATRQPPDSPNHADPTAAMAHLHQLATQFTDAVTGDLDNLQQIFTSGALKGNVYQTKRVAHLLDFLHSLPGQQNPLLAAVLFHKGPGNKYDGLEYLRPEKLKAGTKKNAAVPTQHPAFLAAGALLSAIGAFADSLQHHFLQWAVPRLEDLKQSRNVLTFQDMLLRMHKAVQSGPMRSTLRNRFRVALIDEFQDTDHIQLEIFQQIFQTSPHRLICVGDPKQSIYRFRGAELDCYLKARDDEKSCIYSLTTNYRSDHAVVEAVNHLFLNADDPFGPRIPFRSASVPDDKETPLPPERPPFLFRSLGPNTAKPEVAMAVVLEISDLLQTHRFETGASVAVLVNAHHQAQAVARALRSANIPYLRRIEESVFSSEPAILLHIAMAGLLQPANPPALKAALLTPLLGFSAAQLQTLESDVPAMDRTFASVHQLSEIWRTHGFMAAFQTLLTEYSTRQRLLQTTGGEETLALYLQLAELLHQHEQSARFSPEALFRWLGDQINGAGDADPEAARIRRPSDGDAVTISTIHASKGLQYDAVILPFAWASTRSDDPDEEMRKLYVALTRARHHISVFLPGNTPRKPTALQRLLAGPNSPEELPEAAAALAGSSRGTMHYTDQSPETDSTVITPVYPEITYTPPPDQLPAPERVNSFSGLTRHHKADAAPPELPATEQQEDPELPPPASGELPGADPLPKGASMGTALHEVMEHIDFVQPSEPLLHITAALRRQGFSPARYAAHLHQQLTQWLATPLQSGSGLRLDAIPSRQRLNELEFYFPVRAASPHDLARAVADEPTQGLAQRIQSASSDTVRGFLKGYIDLVFSHQERFYILDWKSNYLGPRPESYTEPALQASMLQHLYPLQYLLYTVALDAFLRRRVSDYQYDSHFGGVFYVYLRGFGHQPGHAVHHARPLPQTVHRLRQCLLAPVAS